MRTWWRKVLDALKTAWKGMAAKVGGNRIDLKKLDSMEPEQAIEWLADQMVEGCGLGRGSVRQGEGARPSIGGQLRFSLAARPATDYTWVALSAKPDMQLAQVDQKKSATATAKTARRVWRMLVRAC